MICENAEFLELSKDILGRGFSVRFKARGGSMRPFIRDGDFLVIEPVNASKLRKGDIVLYRKKSGQAVVHRLIKISFREGKKYFAAEGDFESTGGDFISRQNILGRVVIIENERISFKIDKGWGRSINNIFTLLLPLIRNCVYRPFRTIKKCRIRKKRC